MKIPIRQAFEKHLERRYSLRLHMFIILLATTLSGILFSKLLLIFGVVDFRIRYPLSVLFSYIVFFVCIRLWLHCISSVNLNSSSTTDWLDFPTPSFGSGASKGASLFRGGGGQFSGAGASGFIENPDRAFVETTALSDSHITLGEKAPKAIGEGIGEVAEALGDDNVVVAVIVLVVLVATILVSTIFVLYGAPSILSKAAFQGVLAASLIRRTRVISDKAWAGSILKATWKPFAFTLIVAFFSGIVLHCYFPKAVRLAEILWKG